MVKEHARHPTGAFEDILLNLTRPSSQEHHCPACHRKHSVFWTKNDGFCRNAAIHVRAVNQPLTSSEQ